MGATTKKNRNGGYNEDGETSRNGGYIKEGETSAVVLIRQLQAVSACCAQAAVSSDRPKDEFGQTLRKYLGHSGEKKA